MTKYIIRIGNYLFVEQCYANDKTGAIILSPKELKAKRYESKKELMDDIAWLMSKQLQCFIGEEETNSTFTEANTNAQNT